MDSAIDDHAAVENACVFVELPAGEVVSQPGIGFLLSAALNKTHAAAPEIVMKRMRQAERFMFLQILARVKPAHVVRDVASEKTVFPALHFLL